MDCSLVDDEETVNPQKDSKKEPAQVNLFLEIKDLIIAGNQRSEIMDMKIDTLAKRVDNQDDVLMRMATFKANYGNFT